MACLASSTLIVSHCFIERPEIDIACGTGLGARMLGPITNNLKAAVLQRKNYGRTV